MRNLSGVTQAPRNAALQGAVALDQDRRRKAGDDGKRQRVPPKPGPANDNQGKHGRRSARYLGLDGMQVQPVARIFRPSRSVMTSGRARTKNWRLAFERRSAPYIEPLMGWTGDDDVMAQVALEFPTLEAAIDYCTRQGLAYVVQQPGAAAAARGACGWETSRGDDRKAALEATNRYDPADAERWDTPWSIVADASLPRELKRVAAGGADLH